jgi:hypothetical protein
MEHPFLSASSLADKSLDELQEAIASLTIKLNFAHRMGNQNMVNQLYMVMESYRSQYNMKMDAIMKKQFDSTRISITKE